MRVLRNSLDPASYSNFLMECWKSRYCFLFGGGRVIDIQPGNFEMQSSSIAGQLAGMWLVAGDILIPWIFEEFLGFSGNFVDFLVIVRANRFTWLHGYGNHLGRLRFLRYWNFLEKWLRNFGI